MRSHLIILLATLFATSYSQLSLDSIQANTAKKPDSTDQTVSSNDTSKGITKTVISGLYYGLDLSLERHSFIPAFAIDTIFGVTSYGLGNVPVKKQLEYKIKPAYQLGFTGSIGYNSISLAYKYSDDRFIKKANPQAANAQLLNNQNNNRYLKNKLISILLGLKILRLEYTSIDYQSGAATLMINSDTTGSPKYEPAGNVNFRLKKDWLRAALAIKYLFPEGWWRKPYFVPNILYEYNRYSYPRMIYVDGYFTTTDTGTYLTPQNEIGPIQDTVTYQGAGIQYVLSSKFGQAYEINVYAQIMGLWGTASSKLDTSGTAIKLAGWDLGYDFDFQYHVKLKRGTITPKLTGYALMNMFSILKSNKNLNAQYNTSDGIWGLRLEFEYRNNFF